MKYQRHSDTSHAAAERIEPAADTLRAEVYSWIVRNGLYGSTDEETAEALSMAGNTQRPRRVELMDGGHVVDSGRRRKTRSGRNAVVWITVRVRDEAERRRKAANQGELLL